MWTQTFCEKSYQKVLNTFKARKQDLKWWKYSWEEIHNYSLRAWIFRGIVAEKMCLPDKHTESEKN